MQYAPFNHYGITAFQTLIDRNRKIKSLEKFGCLIHRVTQVILSSDSTVDYENYGAIYLSMSPEKYSSFDTIGNIEIWHKVSLILKKLNSKFLKLEETTGKFTTIVTEQYINFKYLILVVADWAEAVALGEDPAIAAKNYFHVKERD